MRLSILLLLAATCACGQGFSHRGTLEYRGWVYPETTEKDSGNLVGETLFRYEFSTELIGPLKLFGTTETRMDTHRQVERRFYVNFADRRLQRPAFSIRRAKRELWSIDVIERPSAEWRGHVTCHEQRFEPKQ